MAEHVFTMVIQGDAERNMLYVLERNLKHSGLSWWAEGEVAVRPDYCGDRKDEEDE